MKQTNKQIKFIYFSEDKKTEEESKLNKSEAVQLIKIEKKCTLKKAREVIEKHLNDGINIINTQNYNIFAVKSDTYKYAYQA